MLLGTHALRDEHDLFILAHDYILANIVTELYNCPLSASSDCLFSKIYRNVHCNKVLSQGVQSNKMHGAWFSENELDEWFRLKIPCTRQYIYLRIDIEEKTIWPCWVRQAGS